MGDMSEKERWTAHHYGEHEDEWGVRESPGGGRTEYFPSILTWLTEPQAKAIAAVLNDMCGYEWRRRHPDWWQKGNEVKP